MEGSVCGSESVACLARFYTGLTDYVTTLFSGVRLQHASATTLKSAIPSPKISYDILTGLFSHSYWVANHPNWLTIFFKGVAQPPNSWGFTLDTLVNLCHFVWEAAAAGPGWTTPLAVWWGGYGWSIVVIVVTICNRQWLLNLVLTLLIIDDLFTCLMHSTCIFAWT